MLILVAAHFELRSNRIEQLRHAADRTMELQSRRDAQEEEEEEEEIERKVKG